MCHYQFRNGVNIAKHSGSNSDCSDNNCKHRHRSKYNYVTLSLLKLNNRQLFLNLLWGMLNDMSFLMNLAMVSVSISGIATNIQSLMLSFIYMDVLQTSLWMYDAFQLDSDNIVDANGNPIPDTSLNAFFNESGFSSMQLFNNLGSTLVFIMGTLALYFLLCLLKLIPKITPVAEWIQGALVWNFGIRFAIQQF